jgi:hypothetical protein
VKCHYIIQTNGLFGALMAMPRRQEYPSARAVLLHYRSKKEQTMKATTITLAAVLALSSCLSAAQAAHHGKKNRHTAARSMKTPTSASMPSRECRTIPNMSSNNWFGVDNDVNVYRDKPQCN